MPVITRLALRLGNTVSVIGIIVFVVSALTMVVFWIRALAGWLGWIGAVVGFLTAPAAVTFPFVHWIVDGVLRPLHLWIWLAGVAGLVLATAWVAIAQELRPAPGAVDAERPASQTVPERSA